MDKKTIVFYSGNGLYWNGFHSWRIRAFTSFTSILAQSPKEL